MILVEMASVYAKAAHDAVGQVRKYSGEPYWTHTHAVAEIVLSKDFDEEVIAAALLHDVVEDTHVTLDQIRDIFGERVEQFVENVTDISKKTDGNRRTRKRIDLEHLAQATYEGKSIKLADLIHNSRAIAESDPGFAPVYMREKRELLEEALHDGHPELLAEAWEIVNEFFDKD